MKLNLQNPAVVDYLLDNRLCSEEEARALEMLRRLDVDGMKQLLLKLNFIREDMEKLGHA